MIKKRLTTLAQAAAPRLRRLLEDTPKLHPEGVFVDSQGHRHERLKGFREYVKPKWRGFFAERPRTVPESKIQGARRKVQLAQELLRLHDATLVGQEVLEIGCHAGAYSYAVAELGASRVYATDIDDYWEREQSTAERAAATSGHIAALRKSVQEQSPKAPEGVVAFSHLDVTQLSDQDRYDVIMSWETLEHVPSMDRAFANMARALRPGGIAYHEYNSFFCLSGGHSACTLDFAWGHVLLNDADFEAYVTRYRPDEKAQALAFYRQSLNRMTFAMLLSYVEAAGLETLSVLPAIRADHKRWLKPETLSQARANYPTVRLDDLLSPMCTIVLRKPR
jgi:2-polyprenyl-3-methyl-5-hydroxy-6-metoxy-1,4-benzoquinol methylase